MKLLGQIKWSTFFMLFHGHVLFRTFWMHPQSPDMRTSRYTRSLYIIIKKDEMVNIYFSGLLHVLLSHITILKKLIWNLIDHVSFSTRKLHNARQTWAKELRIYHLLILWSQLTNWSSSNDQRLMVQKEKMYLNIGCQQILMYSLRELQICRSIFFRICIKPKKKNKKTKNLTSI